MSYLLAVLKAILAPSSSPFSVCGLVLPVVATEVGLSAVSSLKLSTTDLDIKTEGNHILFRKRVV